MYENVQPLIAERERERVFYIMPSIIFSVICVQTIMTETQYKV